MNVGSLCTGYGGLDLAVHHVLGGELAWYSEVEPAMRDLLAVRFPGVPNLGDLTALDWSEVPPVDVLTAGYPCQPFSHAGKRKGTDDVRHLWPHIANAVRVLRPRLVVLENVRGHLSLGFDTVLADLAGLGFDAEWCIVRASDVGACHQRARLFVVAYPTNVGLDRAGGARGRRAGPADGGVAPADAGGERHGSGQDGGAVGRMDGPDEGRARQRQRARQELGDRGGTNWGDYEPAIRRHEHALGRPAPRPTDDRERLDARFVEWMMMLPEGWVTDHITTRTKALKALGNGVVPAQAAHAIAGLLDRAEMWEAAA